MTPESQLAINHVRQIWWVWVQLGRESNNWNSGEEEFDIILVEKLPCAISITSGKPCSCHKHNIQIPWAWRGRSGIEEWFSSPTLTLTQSEFLWGECGFLNVIMCTHRTTWNLSFTYLTSIYRLPSGTVLILGAGTQICTLLWRVCLVKETNIWVIWYKAYQRNICQQQKCTLG